ncbi:MAG: type IV pili methyl-accepting chemotaxis transducer N-terminal domain-containing protein [Campylobacterota bacterium]|nr:type IV pili methyl-accepting chemotaxis transducer N-terminal domain-containing protein [Campylobacterota bacterium]
MKITNNAGKVLGGMLIALITNVSAYGSIDNMGDAVNKAGQQRMITQRILKDYALIGMNNIYGDPKKDLPEMIDLFDANLKNLKGFITDKPSLESLDEVSALWEPIKKTLQEAPAKDKAAKLQEDLEALLKAANKSTGLISKSSGETSLEIVNTAGKQRMLSQRMASLYMLKVWDINDPKFEEKLTKAMEEFSKAQETLLASELNSDEINALLAKSGRAFMFFEMTAESDSKKYIPSLINQSANKILKNMNTATELYSKK